MKKFTDHIKDHAIQYSLGLTFLALLTFLGVTQPNYLASIVANMLKPTSSTSGTISSGISSGTNSGSSNNMLELDYGEDDGFRLEEDSKNGFVKTDDWNIYNDNSSDYYHSTLFNSETDFVVTVENPNGGEMYKEKDTMPIKWTYSDTEKRGVYADVYLVPVGYEENDKYYTNLKTWINESESRWDVKKNLIGEYKILVIAKTAQKELARDFSDESFKIYVPHDLTKSETIKVIVEQYEIPMVQDGTNPYSDVSSRTENYEYIVSAYNNGLIDVDNSEKFNPDEIASAEWFTQVLSRIDLKPSAPEIETGVLNVVTNIEGSYYDIYDTNTGDLAVSVRPGKTAFYYFPAGNYYIEYNVTNYATPLNQGFEISSEKQTQLIGNYTITEAMNTSPSFQETFEENQVEIEPEENYFNETFEENVIE